MLTSDERHLPSLTLVLAVSSLHLLVLALLDLAFQDACPLWLVETRDLENLGGIEPAIRAPSHQSNTLAYPSNHRSVGGRTTREVWHTSHRPELRCTWPSRALASMQYQRTGEHTLNICASGAASFALPRGAIVQWEWRGWSRLAGQGPRGKRRQVLRAHIDAGIMVFLHRRI